MRGRVKSALAATRFSCRDDADFFFAILFLACVNHQQKCDAGNQAEDGVPAFLVIDYAIQIRDREWIFKYPGGSLEGDAVFAPVDAVLACIPGENYLYLQNCSTNQCSQRTGPLAAVGRRTPPRGAGAIPGSPRKMDPPKEQRPLSA